jgi:hypothetical protein
MNKHRKIDIFIQEIDSCGECPHAGGPMPVMVDGVNVSRTICEHPNYNGGSKELPFSNPWDGIPHFCELEEVKNVEVKIKYKKNSIKKKGEKYWKDDR